MISKKKDLSLTACRRQLVDVQSLDTPEQKQGRQPLGVTGFI